VIEYLTGDWLLEVSLMVAVDVLVADEAEPTLVPFPLAVQFEVLLMLRGLTVAEALSIVRTPEVAVEVVRPQVDITEVLLGAKGEGLLHTGA